jgi:L-aspartate oxidase
MDVGTDFLVIGSGVAGLRAALELATTGEVIILTKAEPVEGNTGYAQGGIAAAVGPDDSPGLHAADTIRAGDGLCDETAVQVLVEEGPGLVRELVGWGAEFDRNPDGTLALAREGAHSVRRVLHARDATGREIGRTLWNRVTETPRIRILAHTQALRAVVVSGRAVGVVGLGERGWLTVRARATLVATGGAGQVFRETTNPAVATGDGVAIAYRAGARVVDLEFVQFHPTVLKVAGGPRFLLSEALRGEGARLVNRTGEPFMERYDPAGDLAARDRVARAIVVEGRRTGAPVALSLAHLDETFVHRRFPIIAAACRDVGLDLARDPIPIGPAAHYVMGGIETDLDGRTSLPGLFAAGEAACTGVHGANRLASNSLLEGLVFGARAGRAMKVWANAESRVAQLVDVEAGAVDPPRESKAVESAVREIMWTEVGLFRNGTGLRNALDRLAGLQPELDGRPSRAGTLLTVGVLMARAALRREESRGAHHRSDFPERDDLHWRRHVSEALDARLPAPEA